MKHDHGRMEAAHAHASGHRDEILASASCACFYCKGTFAPAQIVEWVDEHEGVGYTALCPRCGIDAVLGDASGLRLTPAFLAEMNRYFFER